ncbi:hypothetical protein HK101_006519, partial [Irineochytrium annulatum]
MEWGYIVTDGPPNASLCMCPLVVAWPKVTLGNGTEVAGSGELPWSVCGDEDEGQALTITGPPRALKGFPRVLLPGSQSEAAFINLVN